jgi:hypothetical protein
MFGEFGLELEASTLAWASKVMVFVKKEPGGNESMPAEVASLF